MKLKFIDGFEFVANTKKEACEVLWHSMKFCFYESLSEWLVANAKTMKTSFNVDLRTESADAQFDDMVSSKILILVTKND